LIMELRTDPDVQYVEESQEYSVDVTQSPATWGLDRIDQRDRPLSNSFTYTRTASNVRAYIIDTGILTTHNEFGGRATWGVNYAGGPNSDCHGHGTHVAGTVGGTTYGVAKQVRLIAVKLLRFRIDRRRRERDQLGQAERYQAGRCEHEPGRRNLDFNRQRGHERSELGDRLRGCRRQQQRERLQLLAGACRRGNYRRRHDEH
jgi:hypothetical protein